MSAPHSPADPGRSLGRRVLSVLAAFVAVSMLAGVLAAGLLMPAVGAAGSVARESAELFEAMPTELERQPLSEASVMLAGDGSHLATFYAENREVVPLAEIAPVMRDAILAVEDDRFYDHHGIDARGMGRALVNNSLGGRTQGASTLTQQYVKNVLIDTAVRAGDEEAVAAATEDTYGRKLREAKLAISVEKNLTKDEILEGYLNIANFSDGAYGVQSAARHFFSKDASELTLPEAATLAGIVRSPTFYNPADQPQRAFDRRNVVLARMLQAGRITQQEHDEAAAVPVEALLRLEQTRNGCVGSPSPFFCDYVYNVLLQDPVFGETPQEREQLLRRGGLTIQTTVIPPTQQLVMDQLQAAIPADDPSRIGTAASMVEPGTGRILAMSQNRVYDPGAEPVPGGTSINYNVTHEYGGSRGFQAGSTFKPFTLATWLASGKSLSQRVPAPSRTTFPASAFTTCAGRYTTPYEVGNAGDGRSDAGTISVLDASAGSVNTAYVAMETQLDLCAVRDTAQALGVNKAYPENGSDDLTPFPSFTLGVDNVAPLDMAAAYAAFAAQGVYCKPIAILEVLDRDGNPLPVPQADCTQVLTPEVANGVAYAGTQTIERGTGRGLDIGRPAAGKTGTTQESRATWFVGYTPYVSTAVWVGDPGVDGQAVRSLNDVAIAGQPPRRVYGATIAGPIWREIMRPATAGYAPTGFPQPTEKILLGDRVSVPFVRGRSLDEAVSVLQGAGFLVREGRAVPSEVRRGDAAGTSPNAGSRVAVGSAVTVHPSSGGRGRPNQQRLPTPLPSPATPAEPVPAPLLPPVIPPPGTQPPVIPPPAGDL